VGVQASRFQKCSSITLTASGGIGSSQIQKPNSPKDGGTKCPSVVLRPQLKQVNSFFGAKYFRVFFVLFDSFIDYSP